MKKTIIAFLALISVSTFAFAKTNYDVEKGRMTIKFKNKIYVGEAKIIEDQRSEIAIQKFYSYRILKVNEEPWSGCLSEKPKVFLDSCEGTAWPVGEFKSLQGKDVLYFERAFFGFDLVRQDFYFNSGLNESKQLIQFQYFYKNSLEITEFLQFNKKGQLVGKLGDRGNDTVIYFPSLSSYRDARVRSQAIVESDSGWYDYYSRYEKIATVKNAEITWVLDLDPELMSLTFQKLDQLKETIANPLTRSSAKSWGKCVIEAGAGRFSTEVQIRIGEKIVDKTIAATAFSKKGQIFKECVEPLIWE